MTFLRKLISFFDKYPIPVAYRSSVAGAAALMLVMSSLAMKLPENVISPDSQAAGDRRALGTTDAPTPDGTSPGATGTASPIPGATVAGPKITKPSNPPVKKGGVDVVIDDSGVPVADLFTPAEDKIGITDTKITMCGHAALGLAEAFDTRPQDLNIYWSRLKDRGGVNGREVEVTWEDDAYSSDAAALAAGRCKAKNPFILLGGIGFDQIPGVRKYAEDEHILYLHHMARQDLTKKYSFTYMPSVEKIGEMFGEWIIKNHPGEKVAVVWRDTPDWKPGYDTFKRTVAGKVNLVYDKGVLKQKGEYTLEIGDMIGSEATTVFFWENALMATDMIKQARAQSFHPTWVIFPFNTTTDTLDQDPLDKPYEGIAAWNAYSQGEYPAQWKTELQEFEAAMAQYSPGRKPNDILWQTWLAYKQIHQLFIDCGKDCTRNKIAGLLLTGKHKVQPPGCPIDFARNGHIGGFTANAFKAYLKGSNYGWREVESCKEHF